MQFARVQGIGLAVLGLMLLLLQGYLLAYSAKEPIGSPTQAPPAMPAVEHKISYLPGAIGVLALGFGGFLVLSQRKNARSEEIQPKKSPSGLPM